MDRKTYRAARRLIRDNGRAALRWMDESVKDEMARLLAIQDTTDWIKERADILDYCATAGLAVNIRHTRPSREYRYGQWMGVAA